MKMPIVMYFIVSSLLSTFISHMYAGLEGKIQELHNTDAISCDLKSFALNHQVTGGCMENLNVMIPGILGSSK